MSSTAVATRNGSAAATVDDPIMDDDALWQVVSSGNLKGLTAAQKVAYYKYRCQQSGLNPATQPYEYMTLDGKEILYARRACAEQLRKVHGITIASVVLVRDDDFVSYEVRVRDREGREDFDIGEVFVGGMSGPQRANKKKTALTQAKRRATLSICGEGILDESEITEIPEQAFTSSRPVQATESRPAPISAAVVHQDTGEIETLESVKAEVRALAKRAEWSNDDLGLVAKTLKLPAWKSLTLAQAQRLRADIQGRIDEAEDQRQDHDDDDDDQEQGGIFDAESRPAGEAGDDSWTNR